MKIVSFEVMLSMPVGTVFTKYPLGLHELLIKGENEGGTFAAQSFSYPVGEGDELFDMDVEITGESFDMDAKMCWADGTNTDAEKYVVYSLKDVDNMIQLLTRAVKDSTRWHQAGKPNLADTWSKMDPKEKASATVEQVLEVIRVASKDQVEAILIGVPMDVTEEVLKKVCVQLTDKPFPTMPDRDQRFEVKGDVMDLIKNVGGPGFNEAHTRFYQAQSAEATTTDKSYVGANGVIVEAVKAAGGMVFDDHKPTGTKTKLWGVATLDKGGKQQVVALHSSDYFSVNKLYPHRGEIHLSTDSVGGVVSTFKYGSVEAAIEAYNESQKEAVFSCGTLNNVVKF